MNSSRSHFDPAYDADMDNEFIELPNGRLVCYNHGWVICGKCCVDYSFADPDDEEEEDEPELPSQDLPDSDLDAEDILEQRMQFGHDLLKPGTGRVFATKFVPPSPTSTPASVFPGTTTYINWTLFVHLQDKQKILIFTDGACLNNGQPNPKAGWTFVHGPHKASDLTDFPARVVSGRLGKKGPYGDEYGQTSNRAELRAVIKALNFRDWPGEYFIWGKNFKTIVIATDSEYVVEGATT